MNALQFGRITGKIVLMIYAVQIGEDEVLKLFYIRPVSDIYNNIATALAYGAKIQDQKL